MANTQVVQGAQRGAAVSTRAAKKLSRSTIVAGAVGLAAGAGLLTAGSALASGGLEPGNLTLTPASGAISLAPTFATTDACPPGYQGSAQVSIFEANGTFISRISDVVPLPIAAFHGSLEGNIGEILKYAGVPAGGTSQWAVGCYSQGAGTGPVKWVQYTLVKLSADGKSYSISPGNSQASGSANGKSAYTNLYGLAAPPSKYATAAGGSALTSTSASSNTGLEAASVAGACGLAVAVGGILWYRRRNSSSQLQ